MPLSIQAAGLDLGEVCASLVRAARATSRSQETPMRESRPVYDRTYPAIIATAKIGVPGCWASGSR